MLGTQNGFSYVIIHSFQIFNNDSPLFIAKERSDKYHSLVLGIFIHLEKLL